MGLLFFCILVANYKNKETMDIDARDIAKITDNIKENYDRSISDAQKFKASIPCLH